MAAGVITDPDAYKNKQAFQTLQRRIQILEQELATLNDKHEELLQGKQLIANNYQITWQRNNFATLLEKEENTARYRLYQEPKRVRHIQKLTIENVRLL